VRRSFAVPILWIILLGAASMKTRNARELSTIIIPVSNQLEFTQQCLASLKEHTRPEWELIAIDNGSNDGTAAYLAGVRDMASMPVTAVTNTTNLRFPAAINQGLRLACGEYLVLLNNDVVVTDAWLDQLIGLVNAKRGLDTERAGASGNASADGEGRLSVGLRAESGDPRTAPSAPRIGDHSGSNGAGPGACGDRVDEAVRPTPPWPPLHKGGKGIGTLMW
jgi:glycosyltransferase involved in cell wall biosynthesis